MAKTEVYLNKILFDEIGKVADRKGINRAAVLNELLTDVGIGNSKVKPVVLQIPVELLSNCHDLKAWLEARIDTIITLLYR